LGQSKFKKDKKPQSSWKLRLVSFIVIFVIYMLLVPLMEFMFAKVTNNAFIWEPQKMIAEAMGFALLMSVIFTIAEKGKK